MRGVKIANSSSPDVHDLENGAAISRENSGLELSARNIEPAMEPSRCLSFTQAYQTPPKQPKEYETRQTLLLAYQSLGVVYGDLGTSPVNVFSATNVTNLTEEDLMGVFSLIFWTITILGLIKYVFIVIHANDHGEGGTFALYSSLCQHVSLRSKFTAPGNARMASDETSTTSYRRRSGLSCMTKRFLERSGVAQNMLMFIVLLGTCMVIGDGVLTPATCVVSALQGIQAVSSKVRQDHVIVMSVVLLIMLFLFQRFGTSKVSISFSPIMVLWFVTNASIGVYNILTYKPSILKAMSPHYIVQFVSRSPKTTYDLLGAVFLGITGAEAMFADLGHFNKRAIQLGFSVVVYPSLVLSYAGETAYLIKYPDQISNAYYSSIPTKVYWPMFVISTLAAVVASQSMISACFSIVKQSLALQCFPRVTMIHTSSKHEGQVYSPEINYMLMVVCIVLVVSFRDGVALANAYGVVVIWVMFITTILTALVMLVVWDLNILLILGFFVPYILIEGVFMVSSLSKVPQGGWVPFLVSVILLTIMISWTYGRHKKRAYEADGKMTLGELTQCLSSTSDTYRAPGICIFFTDLANGIPPIIRHYIQQTSAVREIMVMVTVRTLPISAHVLPEDRYIVGKLGPEGAYRCLVQLGFMDSLCLDGEDYINAIVDKLNENAETTIEKDKICSAKQNGTVYVIGRSILKADKKNGWYARFTIEYLYRFLQKNCRPSLRGLQVPTENTLQVGMVYQV